ncbi:FRG domain-containing protein [Bdellovibrio bacteriovorus]|uniref:FRG domain-containing protein n=1 Tax=Bdellovibrio bacteriovorus TaxID=959 RepID=UPI003AA95920
MDSWEDFEKSLETLRNELLGIKSQINSTYVSQPLFRGHANSEWRLASTLERSISEKNISLSEYFEITSEAISEIRKEYSTAPNFLPIENITDFDLIMKPERIDQYVPALAYLRHHGFPSPLLDWSQSKEVAAYFAFRDKSKSDFVSIFVFVEYVSGGKIVNRNGPKINGIGHTLKNVHPRHDNQKSEYTVCLCRENEIQYFTQHELVLTKSVKAQDITLRFDIPNKEREKVMEMLIKQGFTDSKIMGASEDSLTKSLAYRFFR